MCHRRATGKEHVPPKSIFPERKDLPPGVDYRRNLITVPSCDIHNSQKSTDDEFLYLVISSQIHANLEAQWHFSKKGKRAIGKRQSLMNLFRRGFPIKIGGEPTIAFTIDRERFDKTQDHIARGLYYSHYSEKWLSQLVILSSSLYADNQVVDKGHKIVALTARKYLSGKPKFGENPTIFFYQIHREENPLGIVVRMVYYGGFDVIAFSPLEEFEGDFDSMIASL